MARRRRPRGDGARRPTEIEDRPLGPGRFLDQVGIYETGNGLPQGPMAIVLAVAVAAALYPFARLARHLWRR